MKILFAILLFAAPPVGWPQGIDGDRQFESSPFMLKSANRNSKAAAQDLNENGAAGEKNKSYDKTKLGPWFIDYQKVGMDAVIAGIYKEDLEAIRRGLKAIRWGFDQQKPDGSYSTGDAFHTASYFLATSSRALLHLEKSKYKETFSKEILAFKTAAAKTADWLLKEEESGLKKDEPYTHRFYMNAASFGLTGVLVDRKDLVQHAVSLIERGMAKQNKDGANPEKSGTDTSYHALGLYFAAQCYSVFAEPKLRASLASMGEKGATWLASKILKNGEIDASENTRTGDRHGTEAKTVTYFMIYKSLAYWGQILEKDEFKSKAELVFNFDKERKKK